MSDEKSLSGTAPEPDPIQPRSPYFSPRRLGATAPHDCTIWSVDYREQRQPDSEPTVQQTGIRRLEDENLTSQLQLLMNAGLRVRI
jgi:hypothetical protein